MNELVEYLLSNLQLDFSGDVSPERLREFLREDDGGEARQILGQILDDDAAEDLIISLADCLKEHIRNGITNDTVREQLRLFAES